MEAEEGIPMVGEVEGIVGSLTESQRLELLEELAISEAQGKQLVSAALEQIDGLEDYASLEHEIAEKERRVAALVTSSEQLEEQLEERAREVARLAKELEDEREEHEVQKKRLESRWEREQQAREEQEKQQAIQLDMAQAEIKALSKKLSEAKKNAAVYASAGMTPPAVRRQRSALQSDMEDEVEEEDVAVNKAVAKVAGKGEIDRRRSAPVSKKGSSFDLLKDTQSSQESNTLKAMMRAQQSIVARKNIQISQLTSELADAQRRLAAHDLEGAGSSSGSALMEQQFAEVKKEYVFIAPMRLFFSLVIGIKLTMSMQGQQISLNAHSLYEQAQDLPHETWSQWIYNEFNQELERTRASGHV